MYLKKIEELTQNHGIDLGKGLTDEQVVKLQEEYGKNELESKKGTSLFVKFLLQFKDALIIILLIAAAISIIIDPHEWVDSVVILVVVTINAILGVYQENKAEKSLEALKKLSSPFSTVIRNGETKKVPSKDLVVGDLLSLEAGDFIPADAMIINCSNLYVDEASLTGESVASHKNSDEIENIESIPLGDQKNRLFSSTYITNGKTLAIVEKVGMNTEIGKVASMLLEDEKELTPLQHKLNQVGKAIGVISIVICIIVFVMELLSGLTPLDAFKTSIALAVAAIPEGLATVVTIVLSIGVNKMVQQNAIVKKLPAVETLGSTQIVCSDKTGTLTQNKMTVVKLYNGKFHEFREMSEEERSNKEIKDLVLYFALCCDAKVEEHNGEIVRIGDPTETALIDAKNLLGLDGSMYDRVGDIPFDSSRKLMTVVMKYQDKYISITKGAPDIVLKKSKNIEVVEDALKANEEMAVKALRVLGLGIKVYDEMPEVSNDNLEEDLLFLGLFGMIDPARLEVKDSIRLAKRAGIRTIMITGDHALTAKAIAIELGILSEGQEVISSQELEELSDEELFVNIEKYSVYARVAPADKVRIVEAWKKHEKIVAMTGDGVNDAPALKKADIGCAMGITGTDVSKEAADMILVDDNFSTIISAVRQGRGIYANLRKCVKYLLSSNIGEVLTIFISSIISALALVNDLCVPLLPIHLLWINLITDSLPAFGIGMEEAEDDVMEQKPIDKKESFFANGLGIKIVLEGIMIGGLSLASFLIGVLVFKNDNIGQTMAFLTLSTCQLVHSYNVKTDHSIFSRHTFKNKFLNYAFIIGAVLQFVVVYVPGIQDVFNLSPLHIGPLAIALSLPLVTIIVMEISKLISRRKDLRIKEK